jgi:hypothetical protein
MNENDIAQRIQAAKTALTNGDQQKAFRLLKECLTQQPRNAEAWFLLSEAVADVQQKRECLVRALRFDPAHEPARRRLLELAQSPTQPSAPAALQDQKLVETRGSELRPTAVVTPVGRADMTSPLSQPGRETPAASRESAGAQRPAAVKKPRRTSRWWIWLMAALVFCCSVGLAAVGLAVAAQAGWMPLPAGWLAGLEGLWKKEKPLPPGLSSGYWMFDYQRPLPDGVYIGDLALLPDGRFWFGYLQGVYRMVDEQTIECCTRGERATSSPCFYLSVVEYSPEAVRLNLRLAVNERTVENLPYRKIVGNTSRGDVAQDIVGRWQSFPSDPQTRLAQAGASQGTPEEAYIFTAAGEIWAGGRLISTYRIEEGQLRVPDYFGPFGERFAVDSLGDWMILVGQINKPGILIALIRMP